MGWGAFGHEQLVSTLHPHHVSSRPFGPLAVGLRVDHGGSGIGDPAFWLSQPLVRSIGPSSASVVRDSAMYAVCAYQW